MSAIIIAIYMWLGMQFGVPPGKIRLIEENKTVIQQQVAPPGSVVGWDTLEE